MTDNLPLIQIDGEPSAACVADWQDAAREYCAHAAVVAAEAAAYDWSEFSL